MFRDDILFLLPAVAIALFQTQFIWRKLQSYANAETEIAGKYTDFEWIWFRNIQWGMYLLFVTQLFFYLVPIAYSPALVSVLKVLGYILIILGFYISTVALKMLDRNWSSMLAYRIIKGQTLQTKGIYQYVRHPIYLAVMLEIIGYELLVNSWFVFPLFALTLIIFSRHITNEDALLEKKFGEQFRKYKKRTKAFFPFIY